jgi:hypothetical protein
MQMKTFIEDDLLAAEKAYQRIWMGAAYQGMVTDALRAALEAAEQSRQARIERATREQQERLDDFHN